MNVFDLFWMSKVGTVVYAVVGTILISLVAALGVGLVMLAAFLNFPANIVALVMGAIVLGTAWSYYSALFD